MGRPNDKAIAGQQLQVHGGQVDGLRQVSFIMLFVVGLRRQGYVGQLGFYAQLSAEFVPKSRIRD